MNKLPENFAPASLPTGRFAFGDTAPAMHPLTVGGTMGDHSGTSGGGRQISKKAKYPSWDKAYVRAYRQRPEQKIKAKERYKKWRKKYLADENVRLLVKARNHARYINNKKRTYELAKKWKEKNREKYLATRRRRYRENIEYRRKQGREQAAKQRASGKRRRWLWNWRNQNREQSRKKTNEHHSRAVRELRDTYIRQILIAKSGVKNPTKEQIQAKRVALHAKRMIRTFRFINAAQNLCKP